MVRGHQKIVSASRPPGSGSLLSYWGSKLPDRPRRQPDSALTLFQPLPSWMRTILYSNEPSVTISPYTIPEQHPLLHTGRPPHNPAPAPDNCFLHSSSA